MRSLLSFLVAITLIVFSVSSSAQISRVLSYQGMLSDTDGTPKPDGMYAFVFRLYPGATDEAALWSEAKEIPVSKGIFSVALGDKVPLNLSFDKQYWLGVQVGEDPEMVPRIELMPVGYSLHSERAETAKVALAVVGETLRDKSHVRTEVNVSGTESLLELWQQTGSDIYYTAGNVGIGTSTPIYPLHVVGGSSGLWAEGGETGIQGIATNTSGITYGIAGTSSSDQGGAIYGQSYATTGSPTGVIGETHSSGGRGLYGYANTTTYGTGVYGVAPGTGGVGVYGYSTSFTGSGNGVLGISLGDAGIGVRGEVGTGSGTNFGGWFKSPSTNGRGVYGEATAASGATYGGYFTVASTGGKALYAIATSTTGITYGMLGTSSSALGRGVYGNVTSATGTNYGVYGTSISTSGRGVFGSATATTGSAYGVYGASASSSGRGVYGAGTSTTGTTYGVYGFASSASGYGVYSQGAFAATGTKSFQIDHPLDPANKFLNYYCAEGPEPLLIYRGNVILDPSGEAWVQLPEYFHSINTEFHYQLTCIGGFSPVFVAEEIVGGRFKIGGGTPGLKVSWTVTGRRNDLFVRARGVPVEQEKPEGYRGKYLHPEFYGQPKELGANYHPDESTGLEVIDNGKKEE